MTANEMVAATLAGVAVDDGGDVLIAGVLTDLCRPGVGGAVFRSAMVARLEILLRGSATADDLRAACWPEQLAGKSAARLRAGIAEYQGWTA